MKRFLAEKTVLILIAVLLTALVFDTALAESYTGQTMRLMHYEGEVEITDAGGKPRFVMENVRFSSGESMHTFENSLASVSLDASKIVTLDQQSRVEFLKQGNQMVLNLKDGSLLLDVEKKLDENESLDIQTSTMVIGIRGTIVYVSDFPVAGSTQSGNLPTAAAQAENSTASAANDGNKNDSGGSGSLNGQDGETRGSVDGLDEVLNTEVIGDVHNRVTTLCVLEGTATVRPSWSKPEKRRSLLTG